MEDGHHLGRGQPAQHVPARHGGPPGHARLVLGFLRQPERRRLPCQVSRAGRYQLPTCHVISVVPFHTFPLLTLKGEIVGGCVFQSSKFLKVIYDFKFQAVT